MTTAETEDQRRDADARLWEHHLHTDTMVFQRGNLFLVAQSLLAVAYSTTATSGTTHAAARVLAGFGVALTAIWAYVGHRYHRYNRAIQQRTAERLPDYAETYATSRIPGPSAMPLIAYALPILAAVMWIVLLIVT
ncbi:MULTISPECIES: hypothetical protein [unclassified Streptomyces]|jgi:hypothetical protein|uniref:hypothetical protein n=1 Tax=unclassified Streptomyces TaxID=2593676 RepID=UPI000F4EE3CB|nr:MULTISPECIES: hypothetical protein [unclassified Streptomyces]MDH6455836.1 hypothetical protein [Streptomyces sp. SAI-119]MDH6502235.1 hypothetical protein [Streptomyces sp. SAI-149]QUC59401.1 hypothetical protein IOD14_23085 [Streptomyces sp. A2-16]GLP64957.1 hypothetical protein TUSST3_15770 [Streptomyces sp. TUS-ST3]